MISDINTLFEKDSDAEWSFEGSKSIDTFTHNYHRYPAKFIPQLVSKFIEKYTNVDSTVGDVFAGCGTTLVECKLKGRKSIGVDINPIAELITKAKTTPINPTTLNENIRLIKNEIKDYDCKLKYYKKYHPKIDYWFKEKEKNKIFYLLNIINRNNCREIRIFYLCALSHILKSCSVWLQDSTKPQTDPNKKIIDPFAAFLFHLERMAKRNSLFFDYLSKNNLLELKCEIINADAKNTKIAKASIDTIITSPPYVTSYEYADIHQLSVFLLGQIEDLSQFRKNFIGTFHSGIKDLNVNSPIAQEIVQKLYKKEKKIAFEVANYFNDMEKVTLEMHNILKESGILCLVIGNTVLRDIQIKTAESFAEILYLNGFKIKDVIKRPIHNKHIPPTRDVLTGKFVMQGAKNSKLIYPNEFIIIAEKI